MRASGWDGAACGAGIVGPSNRIWRDPVGRAGKPAALLGLHGLRQKSTIFQHFPAPVTFRGGKIQGGSDLSIENGEQDKGCQYRGNAMRD